MKSDVIRVMNTGEGIETALSAASATALYRGLGHKEALHLRLLAEETLGMMRQITKENEADFWIDSKGREFELHLVAHPAVTGSMRRELLSVSTSGKNEAAKGFTGKLRDIFERALTPETADDSDYYVQGLILPPEFCAADPAAFSVSAGVVTWSMQKYRDSVKAEEEKSEKAREEWDELEKSIVANIADEIRISVTKDTVGMTVYKNFAK